MTVNVTGGHMSQEEMGAYVAYSKEKYAGKSIKALNIKIDGDYVDLDTQFEAVPFERVRRITGYLVGTLDRFNDGKRAEVEDRVKHGMS